MCAYKIEYVLNNDGDTTTVTTKKALKAFTDAIQGLDGYIVRTYKVIKVGTK